MNLKDLASLMGKDISEVEAMLKENDTIEVKLNEERSRNISDSGNIEVVN